MEELDEYYASLLMSTEDVETVLEDYIRIVIRSIEGGGIKYGCS